MKKSSKTATERPVPKGEEEAAQLEVDGEHHGGRARKLGFRLLGGGVAEHEDFDVWPHKMSFLFSFLFFFKDFKIFEACASLTLPLSPRRHEAHASLRFKNGLRLTISEAMAYAPLA